MQTVLIIALSLHILAAVFWAGTTFVLARLGGIGASRLQTPMLGAAIVTILTGGYLWHAVHGTAFGTPEKVLAIGIACALLAFVVQVGAGARTRWQLTRGTLPEAAAQARMGLVARVAAGLLAITVICMAAARYNRRHQREPSRAVSQGAQRRQRQGSSLARGSEPYNHVPDRSR